MADSTTSPFSIFRLTTAGQTETSIGDSEAIGMEYGVSETTGVGVISYKVGVPQRRTDVPNVGIRKTTRPATGLVTVPIDFTVIFNEKTSNQTTKQARFLKFCLDDQDVRGIFTNGRFGLRNNNTLGIPQFFPTQTAGIRFVNYEIDDQLQWSNHLIATVQMEFVGDYAAYILLLEAID